MDTSNILFICGGAFAGIERVIAARGKGSAIGFGADVRPAEIKDVGAALKGLQPEDLMKFGLIPEFIGRLPVIATLEDLDVPALVQILTEPKNALIKQYKKLFEMEDVELVFTEDALEGIAKKAIERKTGARGLRAILEELLLELMYDVPGNEEISEIVINAEVVRGEAQPIIAIEKAKRTGRKA